MNVNSPVIDEEEFFTLQEDDEFDESNEGNKVVSWKVLVVDDEESVHHVTKLMFKDFSFHDKTADVISAYSAKEAIQVLKNNQDIALIFLDVVMENDSAGFDVVKYIRDISNNRLMRIILRSGQTGQVPEIKAMIDYDINDYKLKTELSEKKLIISVIAALRDYDYIRTIEAATNEIENTQKEVIFTLGEVAEARSKETGCHVKRVSEYSALLAKLLGLPDKEVEMIRLASPMHDVGKLAIPDYILNKPGKLNPEEFEIIKTHAKIGYDMICNSSRPLMKAAAIIALEHHEKYNGSGYPKGLRGSEIHLYGRIVSVADVFDALATERVYKKAWPIKDIVELFEREKGSHFDPQLADLFLENLDKFLEIRDSFPD